MAPSPRLMTACGAGWLSAIMPFGTAILCLTLSDEIRDLLANKNERWRNTNRLDTILGVTATTRRRGDYPGKNEPFYYR